MGFNATGTLVLTLGMSILSLFLNSYGSALLSLVLGLSLLTDAHPHLGDPSDHPQASQFPLCLAS